MKKKATKINSDTIFKLFENESLEDLFVASDNIRDLARFDRIGKENILNYPFHTNENVIMLTCLGGRLKAKLDTQHLTLETHTALVILPDKIFEVTQMTPDLRLICFIMKENFWDKKDHFPEAMALHQRFFNESIIQLPDNILQETLALYRLMKEKIAEKNLFGRQIIQQYINILFYNVCALLQQHNTPLQQAEKQPTREYVFEQFMQQLKRHYKQQHEIGFYADKLHLTSKYLSALIRSASGKTAAQWIRELLIIEARTLLKSGKMSVQQISNELNFYDQSHFGVFFKKHTGCSPRAYQKK